MSTDEAYGTLVTINSEQINILFVYLNIVWVAWIVLGVWPAVFVGLRRLRRKIADCRRRNKPLPRQVKDLRVQWAHIVLSAVLLSAAGIDVSRIFFDWVHYLRDICIPEYLLVSVNAAIHYFFSHIEKYLIAEHSRLLVPAWLSSLKRRWMVFNFTVGNLLLAFVQFQTSVYLTGVMHLFLGGQMLVLGPLVWIISRRVTKTVLLLYDELNPRSGTMRENTRKFRRVSMVGSATLTAFGVFFAIYYGSRLAYDKTVTVHDLGWRDRTKKKAFVFNPALWSCLPAMCIMIYVFWVPKNDPHSSRHRQRPTPRGGEYDADADTASVETNTSSRALVPHATKHLLTSATSAPSASGHLCAVDMPSVSAFSSVSSVGGDAADIHVSSPASESDHRLRSIDRETTAVPPLSPPLSRSNTFTHLASVVKRKTPAASAALSSQKDLSRLVHARGSASASDSRHKQSKTPVHHGGVLELTSLPPGGELPHIVESGRTFYPRELESASVSIAPGLLNAPPALVISPQSPTATHSPTPAAAPSPWHSSTHRQHHHISPQTSAATHTRTPAVSPSPSHSSTHPQRHHVSPQTPPAIHTGAPAASSSPSHSSAHSRHHQISPQTPPAIYTGTPAAASSPSHSSAHSRRPHISPRTPPAIRTPTPAAAAAALSSLRSNTRSPRHHISPKTPPATHAPTSATTAAVSSPSHTSTHHHNHHSVEDRREQDNGDTAATATSV